MSDRPPAPDKEKSPDSAEDSAGAGPPENPLFNAGFNIALPVLILSKGQDFFPAGGALPPLLLAVAIPALYGCRSYLLSGKANALSLLGAIGALLTGGLALIQTEGIYFAIKEGAIPFAIGLAVLGSALFKKPLGLLFFRSSVFNSKAVFQRLRERGAEKDFERLAVRSTALFSGSFFLSAALNFALGLWIFKDISPALPEGERREILNRQIADMTWAGYALIALPMTLMAALIFWHALRRLRALTGLNLEQILRTGR